MTHRFVIHQANILAWLVIKVIFVISSALIYDLTNCAEDGLVQILPLLQSTDCIFFQSVEAKPKRPDPAVYLETMPIQVGLKIL